MANLRQHVEPGARDQPGGDLGVRGRRRYRVDVPGDNPCWPTQTFETAWIQGLHEMAKMAFTAFTVFAGSIAPSSAGKDDMGGGDDKGDRPEKGGVVVRCSLNGINPAFQPEIFGNPAVARSYGFVRSRDGTWHVAPNCRR